MSINWLSLSTEAQSGCLHFDPCPPNLLFHKFIEVPNLCVPLLLQMLAASSPEVILHPPEKRPFRGPRTGTSKQRQPDTTCLPLAVQRPRTAEEQEEIRKYAVIYVRFAVQAWPFGDSCMILHSWICLGFDGYEPGPEVWFVCRWLEDRRQNYPSQENIQRKVQCHWCFNWAGK